MTKIWMGRTMLNGEKKRGGLIGEKTQILVIRENGTGNSLNGYYT